MMRKGKRLCNTDIEDCKSNKSNKNDQGRQKPIHLQELIRPPPARGLIGLLLCFYIIVYMKMYQSMTAAGKSSGMKKKR